MYCETFDINFYGLCASAPAPQVNVGRGSGRENTTTFCLSKHHGKRLDLSALLANKTFRGRGNKEEALVAFRELENAGLGQPITSGATRGASSVCTT